MLIINTNDFFITHYTGPENSTVYNIYYKLFSLTGTLATLALTPIWSMVTKAIAEKSYAWLQKLYGKAVKLSFLVAAAQLCLVVVLQPVVNIWLGESAITVHYGYALLFAVWGSVFTFQNVLSTFVCGLGKLKLQAICYGVGVITKFALLVMVYQYTDAWILVVLANILVMLPYCVLQHMQLTRFFQKLGTAEREAV